MTNSSYRPRIVDKTLSSLLSGIGAVVIEGPKGCGKTTTGRQQAKSVLALGSTQARDTAIQLLGYNPRGVLAGAVPKLIDEWQVIPTPDLKPKTLDPSGRNKVRHLGFSRHEPCRSGIC